MFSNNTNQTRTFDRLVGIFVTLGVVLSLGVAKYVKRFVSSATGVPFILMQWCVCVCMCVFYGLCTDPAPPSASVPPALRNYVQKTYNARKEAQRKRQAAKGDAVHNTRWRNTLGPQAVHSGACHCQRVRFRIKSSKTIYAVDVPSKVRFPRVSVPAASFEALTDEAAMSLYAVSTADGHGGMGVHTFCSYCGVHVVYSPSTDPQEIQVRGHVWLGVRV